ncbi:hypothetical protein NKI07_37150, partial [Mesorhizobium sp. M0859]
MKLSRRHLESGTLIVADRVALCSDIEDLLCQSLELAQHRGHDRQKRLDSTMTTVSAPISSRARWAVCSLVTCLYDAIRVEGLIVMGWTPPRRHRCARMVVFDSHRKRGSVHKALLLSDEDGFRQALQSVVQEVLEAEMTEAIGAEKGERTAE